MIHLGLGLHLANVNPEVNAYEILKLLYGGVILYDFGISLPKLSALFFFARVFPYQRSPALRWALWITGGLVVAWLLQAVISAVFQCIPVQKAWYPALLGHCLDTREWYLSSALSSVILDLIILILPMPSLWGLQMRWQKKLLLTAVFAVGYRQAPSDSLPDLPD